MIVLAMDDLMMTESGVAMATASAVIMHGLVNLLGLFIALALASRTAFWASFRWSVFDVRASNCLENKIDNWYITPSHSIERVGGANINMSFSSFINFSIHDWGMICFIYVEYLCSYHSAPIIHPRVSIPTSLGAHVQTWAITAYNSSKLQIMSYFAMRGKCSRTLSTLVLLSITSWQWVAALTVDIRGAPNRKPSSPKWLPGPCTDTTWLKSSARICNKQLAIYNKPFIQHCLLYCL